MQLGLLGNKIGMTQIVDESGNMVPVTILRAGPCTVTQIKTIENDGYNAIQVGYGNVSAKALIKPQKGHLEKIGAPMLQYLHEYRLDNLEDFSLGQTINASIFESGSLINVTGKSVGKGFAGLQKRHNFGRGPMTHGSKNAKALHPRPRLRGLATSFVPIRERGCDTNAGRETPAGASDLHHHSSQGVIDDPSVPTITGGSDEASPRDERDLGNG